MIFRAVFKQLPWGLKQTESWGDETKNISLFFWKPESVDFEVEMRALRAHGCAEGEGLRVQPTVSSVIPLLHFGLSSFKSCPWGFC